MEDIDGMRFLILKDHNMNFSHIEPPLSALYVSNVNVIVPVFVIIHHIEGEISV